TASGFNDNEGMYAQIAREVLQGGDWLALHLNGQVYLNKPPLFFWLVALWFRAAGATEAVRAISGLATLGTMLLVYDLGRRLWPRRPRAGLWAAAVYLSSALTIVEARMLRTDPLITFLLCLTLWGALRVSRREGAADRTGVAAIWGGIGLSLMTKGLLGVVLPGIVLLPALLM